ncbi:MAG: hypothetical protein WB992_12815 [Bryobacteraceae bacterium]
MNWKTKANIQRLCAALPIAGEALYYGIQRNFGSLRRGIGFKGHFATVKNCLVQLKRAGVDIRSWPSFRVFEIGTGRALGAPICFYLCGATELHTFDAHRYLRPELVASMLGEIKAQQEAVFEMLSDVAENRELDARLNRLSSSASTMEAFMKLADVKYYAPSDATRTNLAASTIDLHFSDNVFEHVPPPAIGGMLSEAGRVLSKHGVACHSINPGDHSGREDPSISSINFLQYSDTEWDKIAGNRFAYHNRLRACEYRSIYAASGHEILSWEGTVDQRGKREIESGFPVNERFNRMSPEELAEIKIVVVSQPS